MIQTFWVVCPAIVAVALMRAFNNRAKRIGRAAAWCGFAVTLCGAWAPGYAQTAAHFSTVEISLGTSLDDPSGVAVDNNGNVYIADLGHNRVLKETPAATGYTESVVASGSIQPYAVAVDTSGIVYFIDISESQVVKETPSAGAYTQSIVASAVEAHGIAVDGSGNVYLSLPNLNQVLMETPSASGYTSSVAVDGALNGLSEPWGIAIDGSGNLYISDPASNQVFQETLSAGAYTQSTVASGLSGPLGVAVDAGGNVYIANTGANQILKETLSAGSYTQSSLATGALNHPQGIAVDWRGNLYIANTQQNNVLKESPSGGDFGQVAVGSTGSTLSLIFVFDEAGSIGAPVVSTQGALNADFVDTLTGSCNTNGTAHPYNAGDTCTVVVQFKPQHAGIRNGAAVLQDNAGSVLATGYVQGTGLGPQVSFPPGVTSPITSTIVSSNSLSPLGVVVDGSNNVYISVNDVLNPGANVVYKETPSPSGAYSESTAFTGLPNITTIAVDGSGNFYIGDSDLGAVFKQTLQPSGGFTQTRIAGGFCDPLGIAVDAGGNVYVADLCGGSVYKETLSSGGYTQSTIASLPHPVGIAVDGSGNVFISVYGDNTTLYKETPSAAGYIQSTLGSGLIYPSSLAVDGFGNVYVAVTGDGKVYKETPSPGGYTQSAIVDTNSQVLNMAPMAVALDSRGNAFVVGLGSATAFKLDLADGPSLGFATSAYDVPSLDSPQTVTLANTGNAVLNFPVPTTGSNPSIAASFTWDSSGPLACPLVAAGASQGGTLAAGGFCEFPISFTPAAVGPISAALVLTDDNPPAAAPAYAQQSIALSGTAIKAIPAIAVAPSSNPVFLSNSVTFTATVTPVAGTPTGTVTFYDGSAPLSTQTLTSGVVTYTTSDLASGLHPITAVYSGDSDFGSVTSATLNQEVEDFTFTLTQGTVTTQTVFPGGQAIYQFSVNPPSNNLLGGLVSFAVTGLPTGATATFSPTTMPGNTAPVWTTLTVKVPAQAAALPAGRPFGSGELPFALGLVLLPLAARLRKASRHLGAKACLIVLCVAGAAWVAGLAGCSGSSGASAPMPHTYTLTITATSGSLSHSTNVILIVE